MQLELKEGILSLAQSLSTKSLKAAREKTSTDYAQGKPSKSAFRQKEQLLSYLVTRMPATHAANVAVFQAIRDRCPEFRCHTLLDLGAGPGTASWAALAVFPELLHLHLVEREISAIKVGKQLSVNHPIWASAQWQCSSLDEPIIPNNVDLAVLSYVITELPMKSTVNLIDRLLQANIPLVALIEPGTPKGFERIRFIREYVLRKEAQIVAPCPHALGCPMQPHDWCHFSARLERTRLHRQLKEGSLGYEDEKYSYIVFGRRHFPSLRGRMIRRPYKGSGFVRLSLCTQNGTLQDITVTKKDRAIYRAARNTEWGAVFE